MAGQAQCDSCGEANAADAQFCLMCDTYLGWDRAGHGPETVSSDPPPDPPVPSPSGPARHEIVPATAVPDTPAQGEPVPGPAAEHGGTAARQESRQASVADVDQVRCPACGHVNPSSRRFCRCGQALPAAEGPVPAGRSGSRAPHARNARAEREARRAYRDSLPSVYRWRRLAVGVVAVVALVAVVVLLLSDPVGRVRGLWYDLRGTTVVVPDVSARAQPPGSDELGPVAGVVDRQPSTFWARRWVPGTPAGGCGEAARAGSVVLRFAEPVRVRELSFDAGLREGSPRSGQEFRPKRVDVGFTPVAGGARECRSLTLDDDLVRQTSELDTGEPVSSLRISVASVFGEDTGDERVVLREVIVRARP